MPPIYKGRHGERFVLEKLEVMLREIMGGGTETWRVVGAPIDIGIPVSFDGSGPIAFGLPPPQAQQVEGVTSCRCETVTLTPHGNGTHTECAAHVTGAKIDVFTAVPPLMLATLVTVEPVPREGDLVIPREALTGWVGTDALIVRTLPNHVEKRTRNWSGSNPPYFEVAAMEWAAETVSHLITDLPSLDREQDGGALAAHRAFFQRGRTVTEMAYIPNEVEDGVYLLNLQVAPLRMDAAPSRPILFVLKQM